MKKWALLFAVFFAVSALWAQQKYALVIGNGNYTSFGRLPNAVNDANDMTSTLQELGFTVDKVLDGDRAQMEEAITRLKNRLSVSKNSYGFFFYAGHGVQYNGINYLIPAKAEIPGANYLGDRAVSVQTMLAELNDAGNDLNIVVLDACRDFPAAWMRSTNRGLTVVANQPADSIIVYATSAGSTAADGTGRNGLFTQHLLNQLKTPGISVRDVFDRTGAAVSQASNRQQIPAIYSQYFGTAYLGTKPVENTPTPQPAPTPQPSPVVQPVAPPVNPAQTYGIGDTGPAGGIVFYDKGNNSDGWRYLEAAPVDLSAAWGLYGQNVYGTGFGVGLGKQNTEIIMAMLDWNKESGKAAQLCSAYSLGGYSDWFLPSKDELNLMFENLKIRGLGNFGSGFYWSSSQDRNVNAWAQNFFYGNQGDYFKNNTYSVRAIRAF